MKGTMFWDVMPYSPTKVHHCYRQTEVLPSYYITMRQANSVEGDINTVNSSNTGCRNMSYETVASHKCSKRQSATSKKKKKPMNFPNEANMNGILRVWFSSVSSLIRNLVLSTTSLLVSLSRSTLHAQPTKGSEHPSPSFVHRVTELKDSTPPMGTNLLLF
jgi:hypothetical protein